MFTGVNGLGYPEPRKSKTWAFPGHFDLLQIEAVSRAKEMGLVK